MRVIYFNARGSRHILGGDFRLFQSGSHLSFLRHMYVLVPKCTLWTEGIFGTRTLLRRTCVVQQVNFSVEESKRERDVTKSIVCQTTLPPRYKWYALHSGSVILVTDSKVT